jgi:ferredoxin--NADP+ reductase
MPHVTTQLCTREGDCVVVCPVDCIVAGPTDDPKWNDLFFIDPVNCIDCSSCIEACPVEGAVLFHQDADKKDVERNARFFTKGPGYWDFDLEEERSTYKGLPKENRRNGASLPIQSSQPISRTIPFDSQKQNMGESQRQPVDKDGPQNILARLVKMFRQS